MKCFVVCSLKKNEVLLGDFTVLRVICSDLYWLSFSCYVVYLVISALYDLISIVEAESMCSDRCSINATGWPEKGWVMSYCMMFVYVIILKWDWIVTSSNCILCETSSSFGCCGLISRTCPKALIITETEFAVSTLLVGNQLVFDARTSGATVVTKFKTYICAGLSFEVQHLDDVH